MSSLNLFKKTACAIALSQALTLPLQAETISVDTTDDTLGTGSCSLRAAIEAANTDEAVDTCIAGSGSDIIDLTGLPNGSIITLDDELPIVTSTVTVNGNGQNNLSISGNNTHQIFNVRNGGDLTISDMSLINGSGLGGAVQADFSNVTINDSKLSGNTSTIYGGAVYGYSSTMIINETIVSGNNAGNFGGGVDAFLSTLTINNSTFSGNTSSYGGGIDLLDSTATIINTTFSGNTADFGGAIYIQGGSLNILNNVISGNSATLGSELFTTDAVIIDRNNVLGSDQISSSDAVDGFTFDSSNILATSDELNLSLDQIISPLTDNGGDTLTFELVVDSPAIDTGDNTNCPEIDQRGEARDDGLCDIGSFEAVFEAENDDILFTIPLQNGKSIIFPL